MSKVNRAYRSRILVAAGNRRGHQNARSVEVEQIMEHVMNKYCSNYWQYMRCDHLGCGFPVSFEFPPLLGKPRHRSCIKKAKNQLNLQEIHSLGDHSFESTYDAYPMSLFRPF